MLKMREKSKERGIEKSIRQKAALNVWGKCILSKYNISSDLKKLKNMHIL